MTGIHCRIYAAQPEAVHGCSDEPIRIQEEDMTIVLSNGFLSLRICRNRGIALSIENRLSGQSYDFVDDQVGVRAIDGSDGTCGWMGSNEPSEAPKLIVSQDNSTARVSLTSEYGDMQFSIVYQLGKDRFWVERRLQVECNRDDAQVAEIIYGRLSVAGASTRALQLGQFDRPLLLSVPGKKGGLFGGVLWWFYSVDDFGIYRNTDMDYPVNHRYESEPWYIGVFCDEEGDPFPGWLWYKCFLQKCKDEHDSRKSYSCWNAGWGQWGIEPDDLSALDYVALMQRLGVQGVVFGGGASGKGAEAYVQLAASCPATRKTLRQMSSANIKAGFLKHGGMGAAWGDPEIQETNISNLDQVSRNGYSLLAFDFFRTADTYRAHRNVARFFRECRERMDYTECHLGMAAYGPHFQREVLVNHPADLSHFDIAHFSSDWTTFVGFRSSRRKWQMNYHYLMPECGLYYFVTHYSNWGHAREYTDPEPQQFFYRPHAYCGIAFNFHDVVGYCDTLMAAAAFTTYYIFGHVDLRMPPEHIRFTRACIEWVRENASVLRMGRVCYEDAHACIVSKIDHGKGAIFLINYGPQDAFFRLTFPNEVCDAGADICQIYPVREQPIRRSADGVMEVMVRGEGVVALNVNDGLVSLPPERLPGWRVSLRRWASTETTAIATFSLPDLREDALDSGRDEGLPDELVSLDALEQATGMAAIEEERIKNNVAGWSGSLPAGYKKAFGFHNDAVVDSWKIVPWAYTDRVWFVYHPSQPLSMDELPALQINGQAAQLVPRVDYRDAEPENWTCPLLFADITEFCAYGTENRVILSGRMVDASPSCYILRPPTHKE